MGGIAQDLELKCSFHFRLLSRKSFLQSVNVTPGSKEHDAFYKEYYSGHSGENQDLDNDYLKSIMAVKLKLIQKDYLDQLRFYSLAKHQCQSSIVDLSVKSLKIEESIAENSLGCKIDAGKALGRRSVRKIRLLLDAERFDQDLAHSSSGSTGIDVALLTPGDKPILSLDSLRVNPGYVTTIRLLPAVYETDSRSLSSFTSSERGCVTPEERNSVQKRSVKNYIHGSNICQYNKVLSRTLDTCHCSPKFADFVTNSTYAKCHGHGLKCVQNFLMDIGQEDLCLPDCNRVRYKYQISTEPLPVKEYFLSSDIFCKIVSKINALCARNSTELSLRSNSRNLCPSLKIANSSGQICSDKKPTADNEAVEAFEEEVYDYAKASLAILDIEMAELFTTKIVQKKERDLITFIFEIFVILCLLLGVNLFGLFEFVFYFLLGCCRCKRP